MASVVNSSLPVVTTIRLDLGPDQTIRTRDFLRGLKRPAQRSVLIPAGREIILHTLDHHDELMEAPKIVQTQAKNTKRTSAQADGLGDPSPLFCSQGPSEKDDQYTQCLQEEANKLISRPTVTYACSTKSRNGIPATMRGNQRLTTELAEQQLQPTSASELGSPPKQKKRKAKKKKKRRVPVNELVLVPTLSPDPDSRRAIKPKPRPFTISITAGDGQPSEAIGGLDLTLLGEPDDILDEDSLGVKRPKLPKEANIGKPVTRLRRQLSIPQYHRISHEGFKFPPVTPKPKRTPGWKLGSGFEGIVLESANGSRVVKTSSASVRRPKQVTSKTRPQKALKVSTALPPILHAEKLENPLKNSSLSNPGTRVRESRRAESISDPSEAQLSDPAISNQVRDLTTTKAKSVKPRTSKRSGRRHLHKSQTIRSDRGSIPDNDVAYFQDLQAVRAPSKSERNGWLKRRRDPSFAADGGQEIQDSVQDTCRQDPDDGPSQIINSHNGPWHGEHRPQPGHGDGTQNVRVLTSRFQIETPSRLMEVQDSQEVKKRTSSRAQRETALFPEDTGSDHGLASNQRRYSQGSDRGEPKSLDLGLHRPYEITTTNLNASKYFSNAIKQLSSPNSMPAPVSRSKSTRQAVTLSTPEKGWSEALPVAFSTQQGSHHISVLPMRSLKRQRTEQGALDLGMTPRLKKSMSNLPFRPPFKALV